jgi:hypothetical protein
MVSFLSLWWVWVAALLTGVGFLVWHSKRHPERSPPEEEGAGLVGVISRTPAGVALACCVISLALVLLLITGFGGIMYLFRLLLQGSTGS